MEPTRPQPGSPGEHRLQEEFGTRQRARAFYETQLLDHLNDAMRRFIAEQEMVFVSTADADGQCDCTFRAGLKGFVHILNDRTITYPEYRGNGVMASLGNLRGNPHIGMLFVDFFRDAIGLHVNGRAQILENKQMLDRANLSPEIRRDLAVVGGRRPERWVLVDVDEAYIHCSKHIPLLTRRDKTIDWGTDDACKKRGDYFQSRKRGTSGASQSAAGD